jgi:hypothetical protein
MDIGGTGDPVLPHLLDQRKAVVEVIGPAIPMALPDALTCRCIAERGGDAARTHEFNQPSLGVVFIEYGSLRALALHEVSVRVIDQPLLAGLEEAVCGIILVLDDRPSLLDGGPVATGEIVIADGASGPGLFCELTSRVVMKTGGAVLIILSLDKISCQVVVVCPAG